MDSDDKWRLVHSYRRAVANGHALPILCPNDEAELIPVLEENGDPGMRCLGCRTTYNFGLYVYEQMVQALREAVDLAKE